MVKDFAPKGTLAYTLAPCTLPGHQSVPYVQERKEDTSCAGTLELPAQNAQAMVCMAAVCLHPKLSYKLMQVQL